MPRIAENYIEIIGNLVTYGQRTVTRQVALPELMKHLVVEKPVMLPSIPRSAVFAAWDPTNPQDKVKYLLCEMPPATRSITKQDRNRVVKRYKLAMPWTYFWFVAHSYGDENTTTTRWSLDVYRVFFAKERYKNIDSQFITAMVPNVYSNGLICFGTAGAPQGQPLADRCDQLVSDWYNSNFNTDVDSQTHYPWHTENFRRWVEESRENPRCWETWPEWNDSYTKYSVRTLFEELQNEARSNGRPVSEIDFVQEMVDSGQAIRPPVNLPYTFGRWEEFIMEQIPPDQRRIAMVAFENILATNPEAIPTVETVQVEDDGGVIVNEPAQ